MELSDIDDAFILDEENNGKLLKMKKLDLLVLLERQAELHREEIRRIKYDHEIVLGKERELLKCTKIDLSASLDREIHLEEVGKKLRYELEKSRKTRKESTGRPRKYDDRIEEIMKLRDEGKSIREIVEITKISRSTVHRLINKYDTMAFYSKENLEHVRRGGVQLNEEKKR